MEDGGSKSIVFSCFRLTQQVRFQRPAQVAPVATAGADVDQSEHEPNDADCVRMIYMDCWDHPHLLNKNHTRAPRSSGSRLCESLLIQRILKSQSIGAATPHAGEQPWSGNASFATAQFPCTLTAVVLAWRQESHAKNGRLWLSETKQSVKDMPPTRQSPALWIRIGTFSPPHWIDGAVATLMNLTRSRASDVPPGTLSSTEGNDAVR